MQSTRNAGKEVSLKCKKTLFYNMSFKKTQLLIIGRSQTLLKLKKNSKVKKRAEDTGQIFSWKNKNQ